MAVASQLVSKYVRTGLVDLRELIEAHTAKVGVIGLGYVGLPLVAAFGESGFSCLGVDLDAGKLASLEAGQSYIGDVPHDSIRALIENHQLSVSGEYSLLRNADVIIICVPTPIHRDKRPDLRSILQAGEAISQILRPGQLVILESTSYPGTTEEQLMPLLERGSGLKAGRDFWLAFSPERIDPGNSIYGLQNTPKVVGGIDARSTELAAALYATIVPKVVIVSSPREAEMAKLIENTFRHVNIALANELAIAAEGMGVDFWEAIEAAASKPFGFMPFYPGPGVGGHCIPIDPHYLVWKAQECELPLQLINAAEEINSSMPGRVVERISQEVSRRGQSLEEAPILLLGMSYKRGIGDLRESPALRIFELLEAAGAAVAYHDPYIPAFSLKGRVLQSQPLSREVLEKQACVVLLTDHEYDLKLVLSASRLVLDTKNAIKSPAPNCVSMWRKNGHHAPAPHWQDDRELLPAAYGASSPPL